MEENMSEKENKVFKTIRVDVKTFNKLTELKNKTRMSKSVVVEIALADFEKKLAKEVK